MVSDLQDFKVLSADLASSISPLRIAPDDSFSPPTFVTFIKNDELRSRHEALNEINQEKEKDENIKNLGKLNKTRVS